ncbi:MAG: hypothetical protein WBG57_08670 [Ornithinimicrobium sp.]
MPTQATDVLDLSPRQLPWPQMFGALTFVAEGSKGCWVSGQGGLLVKVGHDWLRALVELDHVQPMTKGDIVSDSWVYVGDQALIDEHALDCSRRHPQSLVSNLSSAVL